MKKIFLGIVLIVFSSINVYSAEREVYCYSLLSAMAFKHTDTRENPTTPFCEAHIPKNVYDKIEREFDAWFVKGEVKDPDSGFFSSQPLRNNPNFIQQRKTAIEKIYADSNAEIVAFNKSYEMELKGNQKAKERVKTEIAQAKAEKEKQLTLRELEKLYSDVCSKTNKQGSDKYNSCLLEKQTEAKQLSEKLASMTADDRRDYICQNKFGFKKNSSKFQDCRFKLFTGEMELEKLQMQKELAQAKLETAKASEAAARATAQLAQSTQARQEALAQAQIQASQMQAAAAAAQAYAIQQQSATDLITSGLSMMSPRSNPSVNLRTTCTYHGRMLSCH